MSLELIVILAAQAPNTSSWNDALASAKVPARIASRADLSRYSGFLPVAVDGKPTGFEFYRSEDLAEVAANYPVASGLKVDRPVIYSLVYHGDFQECAAVFYSASVLVSKFGGTAVETEGGVIMNPRDLIDAAKLCQRVGREQPK